MRNSEYIIYIDVFYTLIFLLRCVMALVRGSASHHPCPICLVKSDEQNNLNKLSPLQTVNKTKEILERARNALTKAQKE